MSAETPEELGERIVQAVKQYVSRAIAPLQTRIGALSMLLARGPDAEKELRALEDHLRVQRGLMERLDQHAARIAELEARPAAMAYGGTFRDGQESKAGMFYTHKGSIWFCKETTHGRPGDSAAYVLACKRGADGKDAR